MTDTVFIDQFSSEVWTTTYKDSDDGEVDNTLRRVARGIAQAEKTPELQVKWEEEFYRVLTRFTFVPGGRIIANAGTAWKGTTLMNCLKGDTEILTDMGIVRAEDVVDQSINVLTQNGVFTSVDWKSYGEQETYLITFNNGEHVKATAGHEWVVTTNSGVDEKVTTKELTGRNIPLQGIENYVYSDEDDYMNGVRNGLVFGDGYVYTDFSDGNRYSALQQFGDSRHLVLDYFGWLKITNYKSDPEGIHYVNGQPPEMKFIPDGDKGVDYLRGFIAGCIASDGCIDSRGSVVLHTANYEYAKQIQRISNTCGLPVVSLRLERENSPFDGKKAELWKLTFVKKYFQQDPKLVLKNSHKEKMANSPMSKNRTTVKCVSVEPTGIIEPVYCCNEPTTHTFTLGSGLLTGNCFVGPRAEWDVDSIEGIYTHLLAQTQTLKSEGGWGENFSYIRPRGAFIHGIGVESPGSVKYMELFDKSSDVITSGSAKKSENKKAKGKIRKGAMMGVMDCIAGHTLIDTIDGKVPVKDLVGHNPYLYCTDGMGTVYVRQAQLVWSKGIRKTIKVVMDTHDVLECTPDHEIMLSSGDFKKAKDLKTGDSLAALNRVMYNKSYIHLGVSGNRKRIPEHHVVCEMKYGMYPTCTGKNRTPDMTVAHHVDECKWNNHPSNIELMSLSEHAKKHDKTLRENQKRISQERRCKTWDEYYGKEKADHIRSISNFNHKVIRVEDGDEQEVFDIAMPDYHNFSANGIFVHNCWHPDIIEFITAKQSANRLSKFNVSVNCTDEFMEKILKLHEMKADGASEEEIELVDQWQLRFPDTTFDRYKDEWKGNLGDWESKGYPINVYDTISVMGLWNLIMESTYNRNDPGVLFLDRANFFNPLNYVDTIYATNPCGEQTLPPGGVCDLGSINLTQFIVETDNGGVIFDINEFIKVIPVVVRFLDNVNDISDAPLPEYRNSMKTRRRVGIGILGWGSMLMMLRIPFASQTASILRDFIMKTLAQEAYKASIDLAEEKGMFTLCEPEKHAQNAFVERLELPQEYMEKLRRVGIRNSSLVSIQPTGNTSIFANMVSGGLEPVFKPEYTRTVIVDKVPGDIEHETPKWYVGEWRETGLFSFVKEGDEEILRGLHKGVVYKIDQNRGLTKEVDCIDYGVRWLMERGLWDPTADWAVTATDLDADAHVNDLIGFSRYVDSAISKTINLPNDYPYEDFKSIYLDAYKSGTIKGLTTYREGTMTSVLSAKDEKNADVEDEEIILDNVKLPNSAPAILKTIRAEGKKWYLTVVYYEGTNRPFAIFVKTNSHEQNVLTNNAVDLLFDLATCKGIPGHHIEDVRGKIGGDNNASKITRVIGLLLRHGVLIKNICMTLEKVEDIHVGSFIFQIKKFLQTHIKEGERVEGEECGECGGKLIYSEGCFKCEQCGASKC